jgi:hypothetical protein
MIRYPLLKSSKFINTESSKDYKDWKDRTRLHSTPLHNHTRRSMQPAQRFFIRLPRHLSPRCNRNTTPLSLPSLPPSSKPHQDRNTKTKQNTLKHTLTGITNTQPRAHASFPKLPRILALLSVSLLSVSLSKTLSQQLQPRGSPHRKQTNVDTTFLLLSPPSCDYLLPSI